MEGDTLRFDEAEGDGGEVDKVEIELLDRALLFVGVVLRVKVPPFPELPPPIEPKVLKSPCLERRFPT